MRYGETYYLWCIMFWVLLFSMILYSVVISKKGDKRFNGLIDYVVHCRIEGNAFFQFFVIVWCYFEV